METNYGHTVKATILCIIIYILMFYIGFPLFIRTIELAGRFLSIRGYDTSEPRVIWWSVIESAGSAFISLYVSISQFSFAKPRFVSGALILFTLFGMAIFSNLGHDFTEKMIVNITLVPSLIVSGIIWYKNGIPI